MELKKNNEIRYADLFGGVGGFRLGIERANSNKFNTETQNNNEKYESNSPRSNGERRRAYPNGIKLKCVFYCDNDKYATQTYNKNFKENWEAIDIRTIKTKDIPDIDMLCGGFPCQAFSIAGKRRGFQDTRVTLFFEIARIIKAKRPKIIFLENVKGLLNHQEGQTFSIILNTLWKLGYDIQWMVLNSKFFGVPQNRERVFIIGSLRETSRPEILPFREISEEFNKRNAEEQIASSLQHPGHSGGNYKGMSMIHNVYGGFNEGIRESNISPTLRTPKGGGHLPMVYEKLGKIYDNGDVAQANRVYSPKGIITSQRGKTKTLVKVEQINLSKESGGKQPYQQNRIYNKEGLSPALPSELGGDRSHLINTIQIRRLTPTECERLQGFPDNWTEGVSDTQRYKQMGNAVTVNVIEAITKRLICS